MPQPTALWPSPRNVLRQWLAMLNLWSLEDRWVRANLIEVFKMFRGLSVVDIDTFLKWPDKSSRTRGHVLMLKKDVWLMISGNTSSPKESSIPGTVPWFINSGSWIGDLSRVPDYAHGYVLEIFNGLLIRFSLEMCVKNLKFFSAVMHIAHLQRRFSIELLDMSKFLVKWMILSTTVLSDILFNILCL